MDTGWQPFFWGWQPGGDGHIRISSVRSALRPLRPYGPRDGLAEWPRTKREASRTTPATKGWAGGQSGRDGGTRACAGRALSAGGSFGESPTSYPPCGPPRLPPMPASAVRALPGTEVVMQPRPDRPFETHPLTPPSPVGRAHLFYLAQPATPSPPSLFSCDISDSVTPPTLRFTKPFFPHLAKEKNT